MDNMSTLYFVVAPEVSRIKIGVTTRSLAKRMAELKAYSPVSVYLLAYVKVAGAKAFDLEKGLHTDLEGKNVHGEWFVYDNEVREKVAITIYESPHYGRFGDVYKRKPKYTKVVKNEWGRRIYSY